jgi:CRISPR/Cas system-associated exonuclease Cas4 (RecB family)
VHHALEKFIEHVEAGIGRGEGDISVLRRSFPIRRVLSEHRREIEQELELNPRVDLHALRARVSIDDCINGFRRASGSLDVEFDRNRAGSRGAQLNSSGSRSLRSGAEVAVETKDPPLTGRIDWLGTSEIVDFKTGARDEKHEDQLRFYALLLYMRCGRVPEALTLIYTDPFERVSLPIPTESELEVLRDELRAEIAEILRAIASGPPSAQPSEGNCRWCPAKAHCDAFWIASETRTLRLGTLADALDPAEGKYFVCDVELQSLPLPNQQGSLSGIGHFAALGQVRMNLGSSWRSVTPAPYRARVLAARVERADNSWIIGIGPDTEVFWG